MRKAITITIPEPCHENWNNMSPNEKGRFCKACDKTVHDFTKKTDEQIVKNFLDNEKLCGRFKTNQLNKELVYSRKDKNSFRTLLASGLFSMLAIGSYKSIAQTNPKTIQTDAIKNPSVKGKLATSILPENLVFGTVLDENDLPLPGTIVIIKGTKKGTQTDFNGNFELKARKGETLVFRFIGYDSQEHEVLDKSKYKINLKMEASIEGMVVISSTYFRKSPLSPAKSTYNPTEAELEKLRIKKLNRKNYFDFYKRKNKEERLERRAKQKKK